MSKGDTLEISYENKSKFIDICFKDSGCGISKGDLTRIFTPFFTTKKVGDGTGLGLSVAYGIIINHHGEIKVNSTQGKGTTVIISLPIVVNCIGQMA
jgi:signal transduction histidine kinase